MRHNIGIDLGSGYVKTRNCIFRSGLTECFRPVSAPDGITIEHEGSTYIAGDTRDVAPPGRLSSDRAYLLALAAVAMELKSRGVRTPDPTRAGIAAGLPMNEIHRYGKAFSDYLCRPGVHQVSINGDRMNFRIEEVRIYPQTQTAACTQFPQIKREPLVHVLDLGSGSCSVISFVYGQPLMASAHVYEYGILRLQAYVRDTVADAENVLLRPQQIEALLEGHVFALPTRVVERALASARVFLCGLMAFLREEGFRFDSAPTFVIGGGARILQDMFYEGNEDAFSRVTFEDDSRINAKAFETLLTKELTSEAAKMKAAASECAKAEAGADAARTQKTGPGARKKPLHDRTARRVLPDTRKVQRLGAVNNAVKHAGGPSESGSFFVP